MPTTDPFRDCGGRTVERFLIPPFRIQCEWLHSEHGSAEERATLAELALSVYGYCATEMDDTLAKTVRRTRSSVGASSG